jgi:hypothetical protein
MMILYRSREGTYMAWVRKNKSSYYHHTININSVYKNVYCGGGERGLAAERAFRERPKGTPGPKTGWKPKPELACLDTSKDWLAGLGKPKET